MNQKDLNELKEMTGLVSQSELNNNNGNVVSKSSDEAVTRHAVNVQRKQYTMPKREDLEPYVGKYVRYNGHLALVDEVYSWKLGIVYADKDSWTSQLVELNDVEVLTSEYDIANAAASALTYFEREQKSIKARMERKIAGDNQAQLSHQLWKCEKWIKRLKG